jgi:hypothetical protein
MYSHSACTKHLRRFQLIQLSTLTLAVYLDPMIAAKSPYTRFVPCVVPARTLTRAIQDARDSIIRQLSGEFCNNGKHALGEVIKTCWLDTAAAAGHLGHTIKTLHTYRWMGVGPECRKIGRRVVYDVRQLDAWAARRKGDESALAGAELMGPLSAPDGILCPA